MPQPIDCRHRGGIAGNHYGFGFSYLIHLGESLDVDLADLLDYLAGDYHTRAILLYIEQIGDARKFLSAARRAARLKPVIVLKPRRFPEEPDDAVYAAANAGMRPALFAAAILLALPIPTLLTCLAGSFLLTGDWHLTVLIEAGLFTCVGLLFYKRSAVIAWARRTLKKNR